MIYFDNAANEFIKESILNAFLLIEKDYPSNPSSIHRLGQEAMKIINKSRASILSSLKLSDKEYEVIFTSGATEANNLAIKGYCLKNSNRGKHIITSNDEHPSVLNVFKTLEKDYGFKVTYLNTNNGVVDINDLNNAINDETIIVSLMAVNNEIGTFNDLLAISNIVKKYPKCVLFSDVTQGLGKINIPYSSLDMFSMSTHKIGGIKGSGVLIKKRKININPINDGGGQENSYRSGTISTALCYTTALAIKEAINNLDNNYKIVHELYNYLLSKLDNNSEIHINKGANYSPYILNFSLVNKKASVVVEALSEKEIYVSTLSACSSKHEVMSNIVYNLTNNERFAKNSIRVSFSKNNTKEEIDIFVEEMNKILGAIRS